MTVEVEAFPLHRFLGPLELKAFVATLQEAGAPQRQLPPVQADVRGDVLVLHTLG